MKSMLGKTIFGKELWKKFLLELEGFWGIDDVSVNCGDFVDERVLTAVPSQELSCCTKDNRGENRRNSYDDKDTDKIMQLDKLRIQVENCKLCPLWKTRTNVVFGEGSPSAWLMFIGEAPGYEEDKQGRPFVGRAGMLLTKLIEKMGLSRREVYIGNVLKCRPPNNRNPMASEIIACKKYIFTQIDIIKPKVICTLGKFSTSLLISTKASMSSMRGRIYDFKGIKVVPTFHPAYLLRNPKDKVLVWQDAQVILKLLSGKNEAEK